MPDLANGMIVFFCTFDSVAWLKVGGKVRQLFRRFPIIEFTLVSKRS